jgi:hypothetical protein
MKNRPILYICALLSAFIAMLVSISRSSAQPLPKISTAPAYDNPGLVAYYPDDISLGNDGTIHLLSSDHSSIFRWSVSQRDYIESIPLEGPADYLAYSNTTNRLYLGYPNNITQIKLDESISEEHFITTTWKIRGLATANEFIFVNREYSTSTGIYNLYTPDGTLAYSAMDCSYCYNSKEFVWSDVNRRMYFLYGGAPVDLFWIQIDASGVITDVSGSPYFDSEGFRNPIRVAPDGSVVLAGSGRLYDAITLTHTQSLTTTVSDATWSGNSLFTLRSFGENTQVQKWDENYQPNNTRQLKGAPIRILSTEEGLVAITYYLDRPWFWILDSELNVVFKYQPIHVAYIPLVQTAYPVYLPPGHYLVNRCANGSLYKGSTYVGNVRECVQSVDVRENGFMQFNFAWTVDLIDSLPSVIKYPDIYNTNMYLTDHKGNRYDHVAVGGTAAETTTMYDQMTVTGWFLFPPARQSATTFTFHDDDYDIEINDIFLAP